jgi:hypothetical protein
MPNCKLSAAAALMCLASRLKDRILINRQKNSARRIVVGCHSLTMSIHPDPHVDSALT